MAEFVRLQLIVGEDLTKSLMALHTDLEASCEKTWPAIGQPPLRRLSEGWREEISTSGRS